MKINKNVQYYWIEILKYMIICAMEFKDYSTKCVIIALISHYFAVCIFSNYRHGFGCHPFHAMSIIRANAVVLSVGTQKQIAVRFESKYDNVGRTSYTQIHTGKLGFIFHDLAASRMI